MGLEGAKGKCGLLSIWEEWYRFDISCFSFLIVELDTKSQFLMSLLHFPSNEYDLSSKALFTLKGRTFMRHRSVRVRLLGKKIL